MAAARKSLTSASNARRVPLLLAASALTLLVGAGPVCAVAPVAPSAGQVTTGSPVTDDGRPGKCVDGWLDGKINGKPVKCEDVGAGVFSSKAQTIPTGTTVQVTFNGVDFDTDNMFNPTNSTLVVHTPGRYLLKSRFFWSFIPTALGAGGEREVAVNVNGNPVAVDFQGTVDGATLGVTQEASTIIDLKKGDAISLSVFQNTGQDAVSVPFVANGKTITPQLQAQMVAP
ncbi:hypothetical protein ABZW30_02145 [Kitasatospora sp. NPDC004669]|uniref:hypothetical protein n=1 Tax=Kitasatospora sp. NPDC004669 TaxID=3154555 RepID=UPI0033B16078